MYKRQDFIQQIAGATGLGLFSAAKEADRYAIGVGKSQSYIEPDYIIATSVGNVHLMIYNEIKTTLDGTWEPGVHNWGIKAVSYTHLPSPSYSRCLHWDCGAILRNAALFTGSSRLSKDRRNDSLPLWQTWI